MTSSERGRRKSSQSQHVAVQAKKILSSRQARRSSAPSSNHGKSVILQSPAQKRYAALCTKKHIQSDSILYSSLASGGFTSHVDNLDPDELDVILELMTKYSSVQRLKIIAGKINLKRELRNKFERLGIDGPIVLTHAGSVKLYKSISSQIFHSTQLVQLQIEGIRLYPGSMKNLAKGLGQASAMSYVSFKGSALGDDGLAILGRVLATRTHLRALNLSHCALSDACFRDLVSVIRVHGVRRDGQLWCSSLRGQVPKVAACDGLQLLDVSSNALGDRTCEALCEALTHDKWLLGLELSSNALSPRSVVMLAEILQTNTTLLVLRLKHQTQVEDRLVHFIHKCVTKRLAKVDNAIDKSPPKARAILRRILYHQWHIPEHRGSSRRSKMNHNNQLDDVLDDDLDDRCSLSSCSNASPWSSASEASASESPKSRKSKPQLKSRKSGAKATRAQTRELELEDSSRPEDSSQFSALDVLSDREEEEKIKTMMIDRFTRLERAQASAMKEIQELKSENARLRHALESATKVPCPPPQANKSKSSSSTKVKKLTKRKQKRQSSVSGSPKSLDLLQHLESSLLTLTKQVENLESS